MDLMEKSRLEFEAKRCIDVLKRHKPESKSAELLNNKLFAELFADAYKSELRYCTTAKKWYFYDGIKWTLDEGGGAAARKAQDFYSFLLIYAGQCIDDAKTQMEFLKHFNKYGNYRPRADLVSDAKCLMEIKQSDFDKNPHLLNLLNGTLDLETLDFDLHNPDDLISKVCGCDYEENQVSELWEKFIDDIMVGDAEKIRYLQRVSGYWLTADIGLECGFFLYGETTRNGKDTFCGTIGAMLGDYAGILNPESLTVNKFKNGSNASPDIAALHGKRFVTVSEPEQSMRLDAALYKRLTGGAEIKARQLYKEDFMFYPQFKLCFNCNFLPTVLDSSIFQSNRTRIITFDRHFEPQERDRQLKQKLKKPEILAAVLQWALVGLMDFKQNGERPPECVSAANTMYKQKNDKIQRFFDDCLEESTTNLKALDAYLRYKEWCTENALCVDGKTAFLNSLRDKNLLLKTGTVEGKTVKNVIPNYALR